MWTTSVFFNPYSAPWASPHVIKQREASERTTLNLIASPSLMPWLLTLEAGKLAAVSALKLVTLALLGDFFLTLDVRTPDHVLTAIDLAGQSDALQPCILRLIDGFSDDCLWDLSLHTDALKGFHI